MALVAASGDAEGRGGATVDASDSGDHHGQGRRDLDRAHRRTRRRRSRASSRSARRGSRRCLCSIESCRVSWRRRGPKGDGTGGPGYMLKAEFKQAGACPRDRGHGPLQSPDPGQPVYICFAPRAPRQQRHYLRQVIVGMDVVDRIKPGDKQRRASSIEEPEARPGTDRPAALDARGPEGRAWHRLADPRWYGPRRDGGPRTRADVGLRRPDHRHRSGAPGRSLPTWSTPRAHGRARLHRHACPLGLRAPRVPVGGGEDPARRHHGSDGHVRLLPGPRPAGGRAPPGVGRVPLPQLDWSWTSFGSWLDRLRGAGLTGNVVPFVGHGTLRIAAMGFERRPPTADEARRMDALLGEALDAGAFGMSTGSSTRRASTRTPRS